MSNDRQSPRFRALLHLALLAVLGIWGLAAITASLSRASAQDSASNQPAPAENRPAQPQPQPAADGKLRVGYVNLEYVVRHYPAWWKRFEELRKQSEADEKALKEKEIALEGLKREIETGAVVPREKFEEYAKSVRLLELDRRKLEADVQKAMRLLSTDVYNEMYDVIEEECGDKFDLVLGVTDRAIRTGTQEEFFQKINVRAVVIYNKLNEITMFVNWRLDKLALDNGVAKLEEINAHRKEYGMPPFDPNKRPDKGYREEK